MDTLLFISEKGENGRIIHNQQISVTMKYLPSNITSSIVFQIFVEMIINETY